MTVINYTIISKQNKQSKNRQHTLKIQTHPSGPDQRADLCDEDDISASQEHDTPGSPNPYYRHNASVSQTTKSAGTREGRYRPDLLVVKKLYR